MKNKTQMLFVGFLLFVSFCQAQDLKRVEKQVDFQNQERQIVSNSEIYTFQFDNELKNVVLPIRNVTAVSEESNISTEVELIVSGKDQQGAVVYPVILHSGMESIVGEKGRFYLPINFAANSSIVFAKPIVSCEVQIDESDFESTYISFGEITSVETNLKKRGKDISPCNVSHIAFLIDDSKSNEEDIDAIIEHIRETGDLVENFEKISIVSLNREGSFFTIDPADKKFTQFLEGFKSHNKSKFTDWSIGIDNTQIINQKDPIDQLVVVADGMTNQKNREKYELSASINKLNESLAQLAEIGIVDLYFINEDRSGTMSTFLEDVITANSINVEYDVVDFEFGLQALKEDCFEKELAKKIKITPNPTSDVVTIEGLEELEIGDVVIYLRDINSKVLQRVAVTELKTPTISLREYANGLYLLEIIYQGQSIKAQKVVKIN